MRGLTDHIRTDDGVHLVRLQVVGEIDVIRRDDLRGVWEVDGQFYGSRAEAVAAAEDALDVIEGTLR